MEFISYLIDFVLHLDKHLNEIILAYGTWTYLILFAIIFAETGFVVTPFLPGDSLLFAVGSFAALGSLDVVFVFFLLSVAAIGGDNLNYWIGHYIGPKVFTQEHTKFFKKEHLIKTQKFYEKYGVKAIIIARFVPIVRTFSPFVAGIGKMHYPRFLKFDIFGGLLWIGTFVFAGYFFGNLPFVKKNFSIVIIAIILVSVLPAVIEYIRHKREKK